MDDLVQALIMAFSVIVFVIAFTLALYMFSKVTATSEIITQFADETRFYDNIKLVNNNNDDEYVRNSTARIVDASTVIPTLYRYYKENFCVKIYDETGTISGSSATNPQLIQIFDVNLESQVHDASEDTKAEDIDVGTITNPFDASHRRPSDSQITHNALNQIYNNVAQVYDGMNLRPYNSRSVEGRIYMFGAPWIGSTENIKTRIDYYINGNAGYINNTYVDYTGNFLNTALNEKREDGESRYQFREKFISYSYTGETIETDEGEILVEGAESKDKIVIVYSIINNN